MNAEAQLQNVEYNRAIVIRFECLKENREQ